MDGGIGILIVFVIVGIISAIASSAKKKSGSGQDGQPPRRTMSDIQRAFMMMSGLDNDNGQEQPRYTPPSAPQQSPFASSSAPQQQRPAYTPPVARVGSRLSYTPPVANGEGTSDYGASFGEGTSDYGTSFGEGGSDYGTIRSGSIIGETPIGKEAGRKSNYGTVPSGSIQGDTSIAKESGRTQYTAVAERIKEAGESIDENELDILHESDGIYGEDLSEELAGVKHAKRHALKLFSDKNDYVRAVIYSEILGSGPLAKRSAK